MPTLHIMRGLPASGKTTLARQLVALSVVRMRRVNLDDLRALLDGGERAHGKWQLEETVLEIQDRAVLAAIDAGYDVVVDNTHIPAKIPNRLKRVIGGRALFEVHDLTDVPLEECLARDAARAKLVGEETIRAMAKRLANVSKSGFRLTAEYLNDIPMPEPYVPVPGAPNAVLCDIDGTLAIHSGRGPYDLERCETDELNASVAEAIEAFRARGDKAILLSGRQSEYRAHTERWLAKNGVDYDELWMRATGDRRGDDIVKAELFDAQVRRNFTVRVVLDDRDRVVALWRRLGLPCWQVAYGNF